MSQTIYLSSNFDGDLFESSKQPKEGFEQHTSPKGSVSYRKYYKKGLYGIFKGMTLRNAPFGQQLSVHVVDAQSNNVYYQVHFKDQKGSIGTFAESLIGVLPYLKPDYLYRFFPYAMPVDGTTYKNVGVSVKHADPQTWSSVLEEPKIERLTYSYTRKSDGQFVQGHIPAIVWTENFDGTKTANKSEKDKYLYSILQQYGTIEQAQAAPTQAAPVAQTQAASTPAPAPVATPAPAPAPVAQTQATPAPAPVAQTQATPAPAPVAQTQATPAPAPVAQTQATPAPAPVAQPQATPAPQAEPAPVATPTPAVVPPATTYVTPPVQGTVSSDDLPF